MTPLLLCVLPMMVLLFSWAARAQTVTTLAGPNPRINNGLTVDAAGNIYASDLFGTGFNGTAISKITPNGDAQPFASGFVRPAGLAFDTAGNLFVANFSSGVITRVDTEGEQHVFATGLGQPAGLAFDAAGHLYVADFASGRVHRITPAGVVSPFATGISQPVGLAFDEQGLLYASGLDDGHISKIGTDGVVSRLATIPETPLGFMAFASGRLYVTSTGAHRIYEVDLSGEVRVFVGSGLAGTEDGPANVALFTQPDGIAATASGDTLYVSENETNLLRRIVLDTQTGIHREAAPEQSGLVLTHYPNPSKTTSTIAFDLPQPTYVLLKMYDTYGRAVVTLANGYFPAGPHQRTWKAPHLASGLYMYRLQTETFSVARSLILAK